jgi:hypothetical protein
MLQNINNVQGTGSLAGEFFLGRPGVILMITLWCFALGCALLPLRHRLSPKYVAPGIFVAAFFGLMQPSLLPEFVVALLMTSAVMGPATLLVSADRQSTLRRGLVCLALAIGSLAFVPLLHGSAERVAWMITPALFLGLPIGGLLLVESMLKRRPWYPAACSGVMFAATWVVWMMRNYYYMK